jgi:hypothetical protein
MFFFGTLSTHLPYILLGVVYLASVSFYSLKVMTGDGPEENTHELTYLADNSETDADDKLFVFDYVNQGISDLASKETESSLCFPVLSTRLRGSPGHLLFSEFYCFNSFGRPPPQPLS